MENTETSKNAAESLPPEKVEKVRKVYARDLREKDRIHTVFLVARKARHVGRSGKAFLVVELADKTGEVDARVFDRVAEVEGTFEPNDYILVEGHVITHQGKLQVVIDKLEKLDPEPIDPKEFTFVPSEETHHTIGQIRELVMRVHDPHVKGLLLAFLDDREIAEGFRFAPAAKGIHHAYKGGLADHVLSVMKLAQKISDHYPAADRDLLLAGAFLHDIGKVQELSYSKGSSTFDYTDEGRLVGHLVMTAQKIREKAARIPDFPPLLEQHLTHIVLAHHGHLEYGSPKLPQTLEAMLVHFIDMIDSRVAQWLELMAKDPNDKWTDTSKFNDRHLWKGVVPTVRRKRPVDSKPKGPRRSGGPPPKAEKEKGLPQDLTFRPLSAFTGDGPPDGEI